MDFIAEISVFGFPFYHSFRKSEKGFEKLSLKYVQQSCMRKHNKQKEDRYSLEEFAIAFFRFHHRTVKRKSLKSWFGFLNWNRLRWNPFLDSHLIAKSKIRISKSKSGFPNQMQPMCTYFLFVWKRVPLLHPPSPWVEHLT